MSGSAELDGIPHGDLGHGLLEASDLVKTYRQRGVFQRKVLAAVDHVSVAVIPGRTIAVVGESGSGKSTLARLLLNLENADSGTVRFDSEAVATMSKSAVRGYRRSVQMVFQHPQQSFNPMLTISQSVRDALRLREDLSGSEKDSAVSDLLSLVGLNPSLARRRRRELSGGELQRVALARALASQPSLVVLDEPTSALDASIRGQIIELLLRFQQEDGLGYLVVTHDMRLVHMMADYVLVMYLGQFVEEGPTAEVLQHPLHPYTRSLIKAAALEGDRVRVAARGEISELPEGYEGCRFFPRCPFAKNECLDAQRPLPAERDHIVRCWRWAEIEGRPE